MKEIKIFPKKKKEKSNDMVHGRYKNLSKDEKTHKKKKIVKKWKIEKKCCTIVRMKVVLFQQKVFFA